MILKALLKKVVRYMDDNPTEQGCTYIAECIELINSIDKLKRTNEEFIMSLDARDIGILRDHVSKAFPKYLRPPVSLNVYQNNLGAWCVDALHDEQVQEKY